MGCLLKEFEQAGPVHFDGFLDSHEVENGRGDIGEETPDLVLFPDHLITRFFPVIVRSDEPERDGIDGVFGVDFSGLEIFEFLRVSVIGGDQDGPVVLEDDGNEDGETLISGLACDDGRFFVSGMADHIGIRVIDEDEVVFILPDYFYEFFGDLRCAHLGDFIEVGHGRRGNQYTVFSRKSFLLPTVEEVGDMRVLFGFGDAELILVRETDGFPEAVGYFFRRKGGMDREIPLVFGHSHEECFEIFPFESVELGDDEGFGKFPGPVFAEIEEDDSIIVLDGDKGVLFRADDGRFDEFVGDAFGIGTFDGDDRIFCGLAFSLGEHPIGLFDAVPVVVAVHAEVPAGDTGDISDADQSGHAIEFFDVLGTGSRRRIPSVRKGVDRDFREAFLFREAKNGGEVFAV